MLVGRIYATAMLKYCYVLAGGVLTDSSCITFLLQHVDYALGK